MKPVKVDAVLPLSAALIAVLAAVSVPSIRAQMGAGNIGGSPISSQITTETTSYFEFPPQRLKEVVPGLKGLKYESDQKQLPTILAGVAKSIADLLPRLPNLVSKEEIYHYQSKQGQLASGSFANKQPWSREYRYLILCHHQSDGTNTIEELRTDSKGNDAKGTGQVTAPRGYGFTYEWLFFSAANQPEFRFRYLGQQDMDGRKTFVVAFAQDPEKVTDPAYFQAGDKTAPFYYQGILWVDESSFNIVKLRTDLLASVPSVKLNQLTTELSFRSVRIHGYDAVFWLPVEVYLSSDQGGGPDEETHRYSDYHLFHSEARVVPQP